MNLLWIDGTAGYRPTRLGESPTGGISTSLTLIPRILAQHPYYHCTVASLHPEEVTIENVRYIPIDAAVNEKPDVLVCNRNLINQSILHRFNCPTIWWLHDWVQLSYLEDGAFQEVDRIVALSDYCIDSYSDFYGIDRRKFVLIQNGVDKDVFYPPTAPRNRHMYVFASAPIKGIDALEYVFQQMRRHDPEFELRIYSNQSLHDLDNSAYQAGLDYLKSIGCNVLPPITQRKLADVFRSAWALLMPNRLPEICSNVLLQARACGLPVIASSIGSASEFLEDCGWVTKTKPHDLDWFKVEFARMCVTLHRQPEMHDQLSKNGPIGVPSWNDIAGQWANTIIEVAERRVA